MIHTCICTRVGGTLESVALASSLLSNPADDRGSTPPSGGVIGDQKAVLMAEVAGVEYSEPGERAGEG